MPSKIFQPVNISVMSLTNVIPAKAGIQKKRLYIR